MFAFKKKYFLIIESIKNIDLTKIKRNKTTKFGFQTDDTVFQTGPACCELEKILHNALDAYYQKFCESDSFFIELWPQEYKLAGWFVKLVKKGFQKAHIHPSGLLSGIIYIKTITNAKDNEGAIEFTLHDGQLPTLKEPVPRILHQPKIGDIVLFPSSLYHKTIPIKQDQERSVIAFDLLLGDR